MAWYYLSPRGDDANSGTEEHPWRTPEHAVRQLCPGDTLFFRAGVYLLAERIEPPSGAAGAPITLMAYPGEEAVIDGAALDAADFHQRPRPYHAETGLFHLVNASHIVIRDLHIINSYWAGINIHDSQYVDLINNTVERTFGPGIAIWDMSRQGVCHHHRVLGNTVIKANTWDMQPIRGYEPLNEPPHEAISIAGAHHFEVAFNHVHHCEKEGIDVKETSKHGVVHHNYVHHVWRQGLYVDTWFGVLEDVELHHNVVHDCGGAGIAVSVEDHEVLRDIRIHHNLVFNNQGSGLYFSRWGKDQLRQRIYVYNNTFHHNGHGRPEPGQRYRYITGGIYLYSTNIEDVEIRDNLITDNCGFQIGYSELWLAEGPDVAAVLRRKNVQVTDNWLDDRCNTGLEYPINFGWPGYYHDAYPLPGDETLSGDPGFVDAANGDFSLRPDSPVAQMGRQIGAYAPGERPDFWWKENFPPTIATPEQMPVFP